MTKLFNLSFGILTNIINAIFPLLITPYVLRVIGPSYYGLNVHAGLFYYAISTVFVGFLSPYAIREFSNTKSIEDESLAFSRLFSAQLVLALFGAALHLFLLLINNLNEGIFFAYAVLTFFSAFNVDWFFYAKQKYSAIFYRSLFVRLVCLIFIYMLVDNEESFIYYVAISVFGVFAPALLSFCYVLKTHKLTLFYNVLTIKNELFSARNFFKGSLVGATYSYLDQLIIGGLASNQDLAYLNILKQIFNVLVSVSGTVSRFLIPEAIKSYNNDELSKHHRRYFPLLLTVLVCFCILFSIFGVDFICLLAGPKFQFEKIDAVLVAACFFSTSLAVYIDNQASVVLSLEKITTTSNIYVAGVSLFILFSMYRYFGYRSPLLGLAIGELAGIVVMIYYHIIVYKTMFCKCTNNIVS